MAKYQIQSRQLDATNWTDEVTVADARRSYNIAIAGARVVAAESRAFGTRKQVRVVKRSRIFGDTVVWTMPT
jgi:hypothetical protein